MVQITKTWGKDQSPARSTQKEKGECTATGGGKYQPPAGLTQFNERFKRVSKKGLGRCVPPKEDHRT